MRIDEILARGGDPVFSFEFFPPKTEVGERNLKAALEELRTLEPAFVSVTYGAGGSTREKTIEIVKQIKDDYGLEAMAHFTCVGATVAELHDTLAEMERAGIDNVLALRGDPPAGEEVWSKTPGGLEYSRELVELVSAGYPFAIGAACFPETHIHAESPESDLEHLAEKVDAGVDFLITNLFFDNAAYFRFLERARAAGIDVPIIPGIMPITRAGQIERMAKLCGASISKGLQHELRAARRGPRGRDRLRRRPCHPAVRRAARRRCAGNPLLHAQPLPRRARDSERPEARQAVGQRDLGRRAYGPGGRRLGAGFGADPRPLAALSATARLTLAVGALARVGRVDDRAHLRGLFNDMQQLEVAGVDAPIGKRPFAEPVEQTLPLALADEDRGKVTDGGCLNQRQRLEQLVHGAEAAGADDEGTCVAHEHHLACEEVLEA